MAPIRVDPAAVIRISISAEGTTLSASRRFAAAAVFAAAAAALLAWGFGSGSVAAAQGADQPPAHVSWILSFLFEELSHVLVGVIAAAAGVLAHRAWARRRWRPAPAATVAEAVLVVDLVDSTQLATRHGDALAMRARNVIERRALAAAESHGVTFVETTGDGCMTTFPSVAAAMKAASKLLRGLSERPPDMSPGPPLEVRAAIAYGEILIDAHGHRHGATINKAFRLMGVPSEAFVNVEGEARLAPIPDRNRIFLDEDAANDARSPDAALRQVGVCRLKGFSGFHRVFELHRGEK